MTETMSAYIYADIGVAQHTLSPLRALCQRWHLTCRFITAQDIIKGMPAPHFLIMPGGADIPYGQKLNGVGNTTIKQWVAQGTVYIGICAGAYYGCTSIHWDNTASCGTPQQNSQKPSTDYSIEPRELKFYPGTAYGPLYPYAIHPEFSTARTVKLNLSKDDDGKQSILAYYNGGCFFHMSKQNPLDNDKVTILATYDLDSTPHNHHFKPMPTGRYPAIIKCTYQGGIAILSGVHFELPIPSQPSHDDFYALQDFIKFHVLA